MSELRELRARITVETDAALNTEARAFKRDKADVAREILHLWALKKIMAANMLVNTMKGEGIAAAAERRADGDETE